MHKVKAVVALEQDAPVVVTTINVPDPGKGEALVKVLTCGVCQTDHHYVTGGVGQDFPYLLGHESAGIVEAVGDDVTDIAPGDLVILNWRAVCGECRACRKGQPQYCFATHNATQKMTLEDGTELTPALGIGSFAEKTLVAAGQCTKITADISPEQYAAIGLLGCGVTAGTPVNSSAVSPSLSSVAAASAPQQSQAHSSVAQPPSSPSTSTKRSWHAHASTAQPTP